MFDLKGFRKHKKLSQAEICKITGYSQSGISNIERGAANISQDALDALIATYGDDVHKFIKNDSFFQTSNNKELAQALLEIRHLQEILEEKERLICVLLKQNDTCDIELEEVLDTFSDDEHQTIKKFSGKINQKKGIIYIRDCTGEVEIDLSK